MREEFSLPYYNDELEHLLNKDLSITEFLEGLFNDRERIEYSEMCGRLASHHSTDGGAPDVSDFEITDVEFNEENLTGSCQTEFTVYFFYGCSDLNTDAEDSIKWDFKINKEEYIVEFIGEEPWIREPEGY